MEGGIDKKVNHCSQEGQLSKWVLPNNWSIAHPLVSWWYMKLRVVNQCSQEGLCTANSPKVSPTPDRVWNPSRSGGRLPMPMSTPKTTPHPTTHRPKWPFWLHDLWLMPRCKDWMVNRMYILLAISVDNSQDHGRWVILTGGRIKNLIILEISLRVLDRFCIISGWGELTSGLLLSCQFSLKNRS